VGGCHLEDISQHVELKFFVGGGMFATAWQMKALSFLFCVDESDSVKNNKF
jgi:hypothetical protein